MKTRTNIYFFFLAIGVAVILMVAGASLQSSSTNASKMLQVETHNPSLWFLDIASIFFVILTFWIGFALRNQEIENQKLLDEQQKLRELDAQRTAELLTKLADQDEQLKLMLSKLDVVEDEIQRNAETALLPISDRTNSLQRQMEAVHLALQYQRGDLQQVRHALRAMPVANLLNTDKDLTPYTMSLTPGSAEIEAESIEMPQTPDTTLSFSETNEEYPDSSSPEMSDTITPQLEYFQENPALDASSPEFADYTPDEGEVDTDEVQIEENYPRSRSDVYLNEQNYENELSVEHPIEPLASSALDFEIPLSTEKHDPVDMLTPEDTSIADTSEDRHRQDSVDVDSTYSAAPVEEVTASDVFPSWFRDLLPDTEIEEPVIPMEEVSSIYDEYFESQIDSDVTNYSEDPYNASSLADTTLHDSADKEIQQESEDEEYIMPHDASEWSANDASTIVIPPISLQMDPELENTIYPPHHDVLYPMDSMLPASTDEDSETTSAADSILHPVTLTAEEMNLLTAPLSDTDDHSTHKDEEDKDQEDDSRATGWHRKL